MAVVNRISEHEYRELVLDDPDHLWELWDGIPREKPLMSMLHNDVAAYLGATLINQLDPRIFRVNINGDKARISARNYYIPDVVVIPAAYKTPYQHDPRALGAHAEPLPLVVEIWSRTTGHYDFTTKLQGYRERGDLEIWYIHPYERTLIAWRKKADGTYSESLYEGGVVAAASLPGVSIDLDALFQMLAE